MLIVNSLSKSFSKKIVLNQLSFSVTHGEICGLIGPNGSGKTTLLNILMGMISQSSGSFQFGKDCKVGMSVSRKGFFNDMTVRENLILAAKLERIEKSKALKIMEDFQIDFGDVQFGKISAGMKQRVSLAIPFLSNNQLILLDEPSNHLDIDSILILRNKVLELKKLGVAFLIASHIFSDLEKVCDRILFLKSGELRFNSLTSSLIQEFGTIENAYLSLK